MDGLRAGRKPMLVERSVETELFGRCGSTRLHSTINGLPTNAAVVARSRETFGRRPATTGHGGRHVRQKSVYPGLRPRVKQTHSWLVGTQLSPHRGKLAWEQTPSDNRCDRRTWHIGNRLPDICTRQTFGCSIANRQHLPIQMASAQLNGRSNEHTSPMGRVKRGVN
jgi:hypothetical protein